MDMLIKELRQGLIDDGFYAFKDPDGSHVCVATGSAVGIDEVGLLVSWEGQGCFFWKAKRPLNKFQIIQKGFALGPAETLSKLLMSILGKAEPEGKAEQWHLNVEAEPQAGVPPYRQTKPQERLTFSTEETKPWSDFAESRRRHRHEPSNSKHPTACV